MTFVTIASTLMFAARMSAAKIESAVWAGAVVLFVLASIVCWIVSAVTSAERRRKIEIAAKYAEVAYRRWQQNLRANDGELPAFNTRINLDRDEDCFFAASNVALCEPRAVRAGNYGGASFRIAKGITIHSGDFASESHDEWRKIDSGTFCITSKRIVFAGSMQTRTVKISDASIEGAVLQLLVRSSRRQKAMLFDGVNGQIALAVLNVLRDGYVERQKEKARAEYAEAESRRKTSDAEWSAIQREDAELAQVSASLVTRTEYKARKGTSQRTRDLRELQYMIARIISDKTIDMTEVHELRAWLESHKVAPDDFCNTLAILNQSAAAGSVADPDALYTSLLACVRIIRTRPAI